MEEINNLKATIDDLQHRLREKSERCQELERRCHLLEKLAHRDPSSGLRTEAYLRARVQEEIERSIRYPSATTLITLATPSEGDENLPNLGRHLTEELRVSDQVFSLSNHGIAILMIETPEEGARQVLNRLSSDLEQFVSGFGYTVTSFPVDTNLTDDFLKLAMERHNDVVSQLTKNGHASAQPPTYH